MSLRSPTGNENGQFTGHVFASVVIPAHAGIQGFSRDFAWIPVFTGMTDYNRYPASCYHFRTHTFEGGHEEPIAAEPQPNLGVSPAKHVLSDAEGTRRPQSSEFGNESHSKSYLFSSLNLATLRLGGRIPESECYQFPNHLRRPRKFSTTVAQRTGLSRGLFTKDELDSLGGGW